MGMGKLFPYIWFTALVLLLPAGGFSAWTWLEGLRWIYLFLISFLACMILSPVAARLAWRIGAVDNPGPRKVHSAPVPRIGGAAIYAAFMLTLLRNQQFAPGVKGVMLGGSIIFAIGFIDDWKTLSAEARLFWQVVAALIVTLLGLRINFALSLPFGDALSVLLSTLWLVGITNAFNFMDGIDGLASCMGAVCALLFLGLGWNSGQYALSFMSAALAGACAGFLIINWHPAKAFLGDSGSTFIGFMLGCIAIYGAWAANDPVVAVSTPLLVLGIPVFDIIYTTVSRIRNGSVTSVKEWLRYAGRDHLHHRLMHLGLGVRQTVGFIVLLNICLGLGAWTMRRTVTAVGTWLLLAQSVIILVIVVVLMLLGRDIAEHKESKI